MGWDELYPVVKEQASFAVLRYEEPNRRKDKIQELVCQSYEKFQNDINKGKVIKKQDYKCFVTQRAKEVDKRSICKQGYGGTSTRDVLSFYRRRAGAEVIEFDDWTSFRPKSKEIVEEQISFNIDFKDWKQSLTEEENTILTHLMAGYNAKSIAEILDLAYHTLRTIIKKLKQMFLEFFCPEVLVIP